jgi:glycosyltransferase involved in cell wall biosynthesis
LKKADWLELSQVHNVFIHTTNIDNTPVSVMEAMSLGLPVVTTNVGGLPYLFENNREGIQVPPMNVNAMGDAIIDLIENPEKVKMLSSNARTKAETWDWTVVRSQWKNLLVRT